MKVAENILLIIYVKVNNIHSIKLIYNFIYTFMALNGGNSFKGFIIINLTI